jgi:hypothetical protein
VLERARLVLREYDDLASPFGEPFEQFETSLPPRSGSNDGFCL